MARFEDAIEHILGNEGGYVNDPTDRGGETNYGVSDAGDGKADGLIDLDRDGVGDVSPKNLSKQQAVEYYRRHYWRSVYDKITSQEVATKVFDAAVNSGHHAAHAELQRACNTCGARLTVDAAIGAKTLSAVNAIEPARLMRELRAERAMKYAQILMRDRTQEKFLRIWMRRAVQ